MWLRQKNLSLAVAHNIVAASHENSLVVVRLQIIRISISICIGEIIVSPTSIDAMRLVNVVARLQVNLTFANQVVFTSTRPTA